MSTLLNAITLLSMAFAALGEDRLVSRRLLSNRFSKRSEILDTYEMTFLHVNDVHSHLDPFKGKYGSTCDPSFEDCVGGYARIKTMINKKKEEHKFALVLNMGDEFQGTLFFSFYEGGYKIAETLNDIGFHAHTIGNHEFDRGNDHLASYLSNLTAPVVSANINTTNERLAKQIKRYHVFPQHSLAVIGLTTPDTTTTSSPDPGTEFRDPLKTLQTVVAEIKKNENVKRIVAMTHIGYEADKELARQSQGVHLILGGHSHTPLGDLPDRKGDYPTIVHNKDGEEVFIVTAWRWGEVLGYINVAFDGGPGGHLLSYSGGPIRIDKTVEPDQALQDRIDAWRKPFEAFTKEVVGVTRTNLEQSSCQFKECTLGNAVADAIADFRRPNNIDGAFMNAGAIRQGIPPGDVTRGGILEAFPFSNKIVDVLLTGAELWDLFEGIVSKQNSAGEKVSSFVQVSREIRFTYNPDEPVRSRLKSLEILNKSVVRTQEYTISMIDFAARGGDGFFPRGKTLKETIPSQETLDQVFERWVKKNTPLNIEEDGRIQSVNIGYGPHESTQKIFESSFGAQSLL